MNTPKVYNDGMNRKERNSHYLREILYSVNQSKKDLLSDGTVDEKYYRPYIVNRVLSQHLDSVLYANEMNKYYSLDRKMQYDFYINSLKPRKRISPWTKRDTLEHLELVKEYYGYSHNKAIAALRILTKSQLDEIKLLLYKGG